MIYPTSMEVKITRRGERGSQGGYFPQYEEFAICVYNAMLSGDLEEIRVADMVENVGKLDDIVYVTSNEVHAYQVKWTTVDDTMSYLEFKSLLSGIVLGWRNLKQLYPDKIVYPKLLTNRLLTDADNSIKALAGKAAGGFVAYEREVLKKLKENAVINPIWSDAIEDLKDVTNLVGTEWDSFWAAFSFVFAYKQELIEVADANNDQRVWDIICLNRRIQEIVARPGVDNPVSYRDLMVSLGWEKRFETSYDHNLVVPEDSYIPNAKGMKLLNDCLQGKTKGYMFLKGSPGSGKSTLLTQWIRNRENPSVRFYAFDFLHPSSQRNNDNSRGNSSIFLSDIVKQIHKTGIMTNTTLPPVMDLSVLKARFYSQLESISENYKNSGVPFVIVVDGLDHITREYKGCMDTLMEVLPSPTDIPEGVVFVLGSQHFDHLRLNPAIEKQSTISENLVEMPPLSKDETTALCEKLLAADLVSDDMLDKCWGKSKGHPLYLRYLINQIAIGGADVLKEIDENPEGIEDYYLRIVGPLLDEASMKNALGLISRIAGIIKLGDVRTLCEEQTLIDIKKQMWHLFRYDKSGQELTFFHNSFRQYLLNKTAEDALTGVYDHQKAILYYQQLATHFKNTWDRGYYLYKAEEYNVFVSEITPEHLFKEAQNYRPLWSIRRDMERGVDIGRVKKDPYLLVRYMLLENQLSQMDNQEYSVFSIVDEFIASGRSYLAKAIIREGRQLHCSQDYAMDLAITYLKQGDKEEANLLFELSYPDFLARRPEEHHNRYRDLESKIASLTNWVNTASYFMSWEDIEKKISVFVPYLQSFADHDGQSFNKERCNEGFIGAYLSSLVEQERWQDLAESEKNHFPLEQYSHILFKVYEKAIYHLSETTQEKELLDFYFGVTEKLYEFFKTSDVANLRMAYLAQKSGQAEDKIAFYLERVAWNGLGTFYQNDTGQAFRTLSAHIYFVQTRARFGIEDKMMELVPDDKAHQDNEMMVIYARRVFAIAQMAGKAQAGVIDSSFMSQVKFCIRSFDAAVNPVPYNRYSYTISEQRSDFYEFIVELAKYFGHEMIGAIAKEFEMYFSGDSCKANAHSKRVTIIALYRVGYDRRWCAEQLSKLDVQMLNSQDIDGRERECLEQGHAWVELGYLDNAEKCYHQMIEETFGVGYRKDYQPALFAEWIGEAIKLHPQHMENYVHWLSSRLKHIESVAESRTRLRAAERLLGEVLQFNLMSGLKLAKWFLDSEYDYFQSVSSDLLTAMLRAANDRTEYQALFRYYTELHLYIDDNDATEVNTSLMEEVIESGKRILEDDFSDYIPILKNRIATECPESISLQMEKALDDILNNGGQHSEQTERDRDKIMTEARMFLSEGRKEDAWAKTMEYLTNSNSSGWARYYDGGSRINACKMLREIDREKGQNYAIELFAQDIPNGYSYGTMQYLDEIVPLLVDDVDRQRLFDEKFSYMNRILREDAICYTDMPEITPDNSGVCEIIREWLLYLLKMPVVCIAERAKVILAHLYDESSVLLIERLIEEMKSERSALEIGCYLAQLQSSRLLDFLELAKQAANSTNYQLRVYASKILNELGEKVPETSYRALPATYSMVFPDMDDNPLASLLGENNEGTVNWRNVNSIMSVASHWGEYIAYCTGINKRTLNYRAVQLMKQYGDVTVDNEHEDAAIRHHYDTINLRYSYKKSHASAALDGMLSVAAELNDGNAVNGRYLDVVFVSMDFNNIRIEAKKKPDFIQRISPPESWSVDKKWLDESHSSSRFSEGVQEYEGKVVIGEYCHIKKMGEKLPLEEFQAKISFDNEKTDMSRNNSIFGESLFMLDSADYLKTGYGDPELILLRSGYYTDFSNKTRWIALNPAFADWLNLYPCGEGNFAWQNADGEKVVESVYWQSGNINGSSRDHYEASEGWLVVMNKELFKTICSKTNVYLHQMVMRRYSDNLLDTSHNSYNLILIP